MGKELRGIFTVLFPFLRWEMVEGFGCGIEVGVRMSKVHEEQKLRKVRLNFMALVLFGNYKRHRRPST
jgi:hypothetical protein